MEMWGHMSKFLKNYKSFFMAIIIFDILIGKVQGFNFFHILYNACYFLLLFLFNHSQMSMLQYVRNINFLNN